MNREERSFRKAKEILREKGLLAEIDSIASSFNKISSNVDSLSKGVFKSHGWETNKVMKLAEYNRPQFDAFKDRVIVEVEHGEQMNLRSHLLFIEVAYRERLADVGLVFIRDNPKGVRFERTVKELGEEGNLFTYHFPLYAPLYLVKV